MRVAFSADHAGAALKDDLIRRLDAAGVDHELIDLGGDGSDPNDDYPDFAERLGQAIVAGEADRGILICGRGSARPWPPTRCAGSARPCATTPIRPIRGSSTTT
jgi:ribose 5-phosphate isomerase B